MELKRVETRDENEFILKMDFYEANDLLCMILPVAEKQMLEMFKADVRMQTRYTRGDKIRIRRIRKLQDDLQQALGTK